MGPRPAAPSPPTTVSPQTGESRSWANSPDFQIISGCPGSGIYKDTETHGQELGDRTQTQGGHTNSTLHSLAAACPASPETPWSPQHIPKVAVNIPITDTGSDVSKPAHRGLQPVASTQGTDTPALGSRGSPKHCPPHWKSSCAPPPHDSACCLRPATAPALPSTGLEGARDGDPGPHPQL